MRTETSHTFTEGNQFWKQRSKHGRDKLFKTPELLFEAACEYFQWCDDNPLYETEQTKGGAKVLRGVNGEDVVTGQTIELPKMRAYTLTGLLLYIHASEGYWGEFKRNCQKGKLSDFLAVINEVEMIIYNQKFTGAAAGFLNPNIIARDLGLAEKHEVDQTTTITGESDFVVKIVKGGE